MARGFRFQPEFSACRTTARLLRRTSSLPYQTEMTRLVQGPVTRTLHYISDLRVDVYSNRWADLVRVAGQSITYGWLTSGELVFRAAGITHHSVTAAARNDRKRCVQPPRVRESAPTVGTAGNLREPQDSSCVLKRFSAHRGCKEWLFDLPWPPCQNDVSFWPLLRLAFPLLTRLVVVVVCLCF